MEDLPQYLLASVVIAASPGPVVLSLAAIGATIGIRRSVPYWFGITLGSIAATSIVATGVVGIFLALPGVMPIATAVAIGYFVYLAYRIATAPPIVGDAEEHDHATFASGFLVAIVNPKAYLGIGALFASFTVARASLALDLAIKIGAFSAIVVATNVAWLCAGAALTREFADPRHSRVINIAFAVLLLASIGFLVKW